MQTTKLPAFTEILCIDYSGNGYPIFDLMVPNGRHHVSSSYTVFYTEDDELLTRYYELCDDIPKTNEFFLKHPECIFSLSDIRQKYGTIPDVMVYTQLCQNLKRSMEQGYACFAHYIDEHANCHVFRTQDARRFDRDLFEASSQKSVSTTLWKLHARLAHLHKQGDISPFVSYKGKCVEAILKSRSNFVPTLHYEEYVQLMQKLEKLKSKLPGLESVLTKNDIQVRLVDAKGFICRQEKYWVFSFEKNEETFESIDKGLQWFADALVQKWTSHLQASIKSSFY